MKKGFLFCTEKGWRVKYTEGREIRVALLHEADIATVNKWEGRVVNFEMIDTKYAKIIN